jgi:hypothetical protein
MSDNGDSEPASGVPPVLPSTETPPPQRDGCLTAVMVMVGIVLLLPGLCALIFGVGSIVDVQHYDNMFTVPILVGLLVGFGGIMLIRAAVRGPRR